MEDVVEQVVDSAADMVDGRIPGSNLGHLAIVSAVALGAGAGIAWFAAKRYYTAKFEEVLEQERLEIKAFYAQLHKKDEYATPGDAAEALGTPVIPVAAAKALQSYGSENLEDVAVTVTETVEVEVQPEPELVRSNVFKDRESKHPWDQEGEDAARETLSPGEPFIISSDEYGENEHEYEQKTLTYFAEDDVLVDEKDQPIEEIDNVVGEENLTHFGYGSNDNRIVLIRNDRLGMEFEVVKNEGSYSKLVLGFQHSSDEPKVRRMRGAYE